MDFFNAWVAFLMSLSNTPLATICCLPQVKVLKTSKKRPKVIDLNDKEMMKVFYEKKSFSRFYKQPAGKRFVANAKMINLRGFKAPQIIESWEEGKAIIVRYKKIAGVNFETIKTHLDKSLLVAFIDLIAKLHENGIFFRSLHLTNFLYHQNDGFSLIDVDEVTFTRRRLPLHMRYRNLKHLFTYRKDKLFWSSSNLNEILDCYLKASELPRIKCKILKWLFKVSK